jgi:hypothetical protein
MKLYVHLIFLEEFTHTNDIKVIFMYIVVEEAEVLWKKN